MCSCFNRHDHEGKQCQRAATESNGMCMQCNIDTPKINNEDEDF